MLHAIIVKVVVEMEDQRVFILSNWTCARLPHPLMLSANELHRVTDRSHEATDRPHQARVGVFDNTPYFTQLCAQTNALPRSQAAVQLFAILEVSIRPVSTTVSKWWTILTLNRKELEMQRSKLLLSLSGTQIAMSSPRTAILLVNVLISKFFTGQTGRLTDGQNRLLNPFAHARAGKATIIKCLVSVPPPTSIFVNLSNKLLLREPERAPH